MFGEFWVYHANEECWREYFFIYVMYYRTNRRHFFSSDRCYHSWSLSCYGILLQIGLSPVSFPSRMSWVGAQNKVKEHGEKVMQKDQIEHGDFFRLLGITIVGTNPAMTACRLNPRLPSLQLPGPESDFFFFGGVRQKNGVTTNQDKK